MKKTVTKSGFVIFLLLVCMGYADEQVKASVPQQAFKLRCEGKSQQAKEMLLAYLQSHPDDATAHFEMSRTLAYLMDLETAEEHAILAVEKRPTDAAYCNWHGKCAAYLFVDQAHHKKNMDTEILARSIAAYEKAVELRPEFHEARFELIGLLSQSGAAEGEGKEKVDKHIDYLIEKAPYYGLQVNLRLNRKKADEWKIKQYESAIAKAPKNADLYAGMAKLYAKSGDIAAMQEHLDKAIELDKTQKKALLAVVFPLSMQKDHQTAKKMVQRYLELSDDEPAAMRAFATFYLARIDKNSGDPNADNTLKQARQIDPDVWMTMMPPAPEMFEPL